MTPERYTANLSGFRYRVISRDGDEVRLFCETTQKERTVDKFVLRHMFTPIIVETPLQSKHTPERVNIPSGTQTPRSVKSNGVKQPKQQG